MEQEKIKLSSVEATAYWWVNVIKNKVKEILKSGTSSKDEKRFAKIFFRYTEREYRILYLELIKYIEQDMINHIMNSGENVYHQDTDIMGHNDINKALFKITNCSIPDIRIASNNSKDVVTYTNLFQATVWYKSCGESNLLTMYDPTYILTGDEQKLNFYNLLILTIMIIHKANVMFDSLDLLGEGFCETYIKLNKLKENQEEVKEKFNQAIEEACDVGLISVKSYSKKYFCWFREFDFVGLEQYLEEAKYYAEVILGENFSLDIEANIKKLRRTASKKV